MRRVAVYGGTRNVYNEMATAAKSLAIHTRMDRIILLTEDDDFTEPLPGYVETINVGGQEWFDPGGENFATRWTWMTLMRLALTKILPDEDSCLWLDVDTIVEMDIGELFETDLDGWLFAGCHEPTRSRQALKYYNAGVLLMNLKALRETGRDEDMIRAINTRKYIFADQDVINEKCAGEILEIDGDYNACDFTMHSLNPKIVHYAADRGYAWNRRFAEYGRLAWPAE